MAVASSGGPYASLHLVPDRLVALPATQPTASEH